MSTGSNSAEMYRFSFLLFPLFFVKTNKPMAIAWKLGLFA